MSELLPVGTSATLRRMVTREVVETFGDLIGDHDRIHFDDAFASQTAYGKPIAHGALMLGYMSAASTLAAHGCPIPLVSLGYDKLRFVAAAMIGEEVEVHFEITGHDDPRNRAFANVTVKAGDRLLAVARNIIARSP